MPPGNWKLKLKKYVFIFFYGYRGLVKLKQIRKSEENSEVGGSSPKSDFYCVFFVLLFYGGRWMVSDQSEFFSNVCFFFNLDPLGYAVNFKCADIYYKYVMRISYRSFCLHVYG